MGCPSIGIYSYELYNEYDVDCIMRIGTAGAYSDSLKLFDVINVDKAYSESTYAKCAFGMDGDFFDHQGKAFDIINRVAETSGTTIVKGNIHSSDVFYRSTPGVPTIASDNNCPAVEMESFALFSNAKYLKKSAATILTISDIIPTHQSLSSEERERALDAMFILSLESATQIAREP